MIHPQWLKLPMSRTNLYGPKDVPVIEYRPYYVYKNPVGNANSDQMPHSMTSDLGLHCLPVTLLGVPRLKWDKSNFCTCIYKTLQLLDNLTTNASLHSLVIYLSPSSRYLTPRHTQPA